MLAMIAPAKISTSGNLLDQVPPPPAFDDQLQRLEFISAREASLTLPTLRRILRAPPWLPWLLAAMFALRAWPVSAESDPAHRAAKSEKPLPWPGGVVPYDVSKLTESQQALVKRAMQRWMDTGARISFVPRTNEIEYVNFTGQTNAGNNTSHDGFRKGVRVDVNITAFWWRQAEWMPAHELGHVLGFHHEHQRWDRDQFVTIRYEHIKPGREHDYDWIPKTNWIVSSTAYDYRSIMHYRVCWASACESECKDGKGDSPCAVIDPVGTNYDRVIGQWDDNRISTTDAEKARLAYGTTAPNEGADPRGEKF